MTNDERKKLKFTFDEIMKEADGCEDTLVKWHKAVEYRKADVEKLGLEDDDVKKLKYMIYSVRRIHYGANRMKDLLFDKKEEK